MNPSLDTMNISATYLRRLAREHVQPQTVLRQLGITDVPPSDANVVPLRDFFRLLKEVDDCRPDRDWHLGFARRTADHFHGPLTFALMSAPTIGHGLEAFAKFVQIRGPHLRAAASQSGLKYAVELIETIDLGDLRCLLMEVAFRILHDYVAIIGDVNLAAATLSLAYARNEQRNYYKHGFDCRIQFDQAINSLAIPAAWTAIPNPQYDEHMWINSTAQCEVALAALDPSDVLAQTRAYINSTLENEPHTLCIENAAQALGTSVRTLIRRLRRSEATFQTLRDEARSKLAKRLLSRPGLSVEEIALSVGFSDAANFSRAFKRWAGVPPARFRRELGA